MITNKKERTAEIIKRLKKAYPDAHCALNHTNPFELLIATILSAQCTDRQVNIVTADLFRKFRKPQDYLDVSQEELEKEIRSIGFFRSKAKNIRAASEKIITEFSYKHTIAGFSALAASAGFQVARVWTDPAKLFAVFHFTTL